MKTTLLLIVIVFIFTPLTEGLVCEENYCVLPGHGCTPRMIECSQECRRRTGQAVLPLVGKLVPTTIEDCGECSESHKLTKEQIDAAGIGDYYLDITQLECCNEDECYPWRRTKRDAPDTSRANKPPPKNKKTTTTKKPTTKTTKGSGKAKATTTTSKGTTTKPMTSTKPPSLSSTPTPPAVTMMQPISTIKPSDEEQVDVNYLVWEEGSAQLIMLYLTLVIVALLV